MMLHLTSGIEETRVTHWFIKEGEQVQALAPLVTLHHNMGVDFTLRASRKGPLRNALVMRICQSRGYYVSASDILAKLTSESTDTEIGSAQWRTIGPTASPYVSSVADEVGFDLFIISSSPTRDRLFQRFPQYRHFYIRTYPLLPLLALGCPTSIVILWLLLTLRLVELGGLSALSDTGLFAFVVIIAFALGFLVVLAFNAFRLFFRHRLF